MAPPTASALIHAEHDLSAFIHRHQRLPRLGDNPAPWTYRGWLLPYVVQLYGLIPAVHDRWSYYLRTLQADRLLDEPIPQIAFGPADENVFALLRNWSRLAGCDGGGWDDFRTLLDWLGWGLALAREAPHLSDAVCESLYRQVDLAPLLLAPHDYLGEYVSRNRAGGWNPLAFYPTPHAVAECMARMTLQDAVKDGRDPRTLSVSDPCVGSGRLLLHASNYSLCLYGMDIDPVAVSMCKINGALYAPWLAFPFPEEVLGVSEESHPAVLPLHGSRPRGTPVFRVDESGGLPFES